MVFSFLIYMYTLHKCSSVSHSGRVDSSQIWCAKGTGPTLLNAKPWANMPSS